MSEICKHCSLPQSSSQPCPERKLSFPWSSESLRSAEVSLWSRAFVHLLAQWDVILPRLENVDCSSFNEKVAGNLCWCSFKLSLCRIPICMIQ